MSVLIQSMELEHFNDVISLWEQSDGVGLSDADSRQNIGLYLDHNKGLSQVAVENGQLVGAVLCGHDGRRGYIHHLAVAERHRRRRIGQQLVAACLDTLSGEGIPECQLFVFRENLAAIQFWQQNGFTERSDLSMMSKLIDQNDDTHSGVKSIIDIAEE